MGNVLVIAEHLQGNFTDATYEALAVARTVAGQTGGTVEAALVGADVTGLAGELGGADRILVADHSGLAEFVPTAHAAAFAEIVNETEPQIVLVPYTSTGMDVASHLSVQCDYPLVSYCQSVDADGGLSATTQLYAGKLEADVEVAGERAVFALLAGAGDAEAGRTGGAGEVVKVTLTDPPAAMKLIGLAQPDAGDIDITAQDVLVVIGRGIESEDNIAEAVEVADALGGAVAASRPIVDQGWLPKTRQVGKSGLTVKPKVYLALGVSGAPEHIEGMRDASTIIAVNTDPRAPIFGVAHYGWVGDLFDLLPELADLLDS